MAVRFRIRTPGGQELSFGSLAMFTEFVRSGELAADDLVYDGETGEWAPARTHPLVLELEAERGGDAPPSGAEERSPIVPYGDIGLELAPAPKEPSRDEAVAAFKAKMDAERESELDDVRPAGGLRMGEGASGLLEGIGELDVLPAAAARRETEPVWRPAVEAPTVPTREPRERPRARRRTPRKGGSRRMIVLMAGGAAIIALAYLGPELGARIGEWMSEVDPNPEIARPIPDTEEALRARAEERFLASTLPLLRNVPAVPRNWLAGAYLAEPSAYPDIRAVWNGYLTAIREVRATEVERYRASYLRALDDANVRGSTRTLRLASASAAFVEQAPRREEHYTRVERLATAAIELHDDLTAIEGSISYEPAIGPRVSADPVLEAAGVDPESQAVLEALLDQVVDALHAGGFGPDESEAVRAWAWQGFLGTVGPQ
jgi:hypothetical protein